MPVVGHAFVGLAVAAVSLPRGTTSAVAARPGQWALVLVLLSYAPDLAAQAGAFLRTPAAAAASHSVAFALFVSAGLAPAITRLTGTETWRAFGVALLSIALHDLMDVLQSPGRVPLWPFGSHVDAGAWIPASLAGETLIFLPVFIVCAAYAVRHGRARLLWRRDWPGVAAVAVIVIAAGAVSELREHRERDLVRARALAESGQYREALEICRTADLWPSSARPGRIEYVRAMAWGGLGDRNRAEQAYLRAYEADPTYIWTVADLAAFYADADAPLDERRRRTEPWIRLLELRFADHPALPQLVARVQRRLQRGP